MARPINLLSPKAVEAAPRAKTLSDGGGLYLRMDNKGGKRWVFRYTRPGGGKVNEVGLGSFPEVSLANARKARQVQHDWLATGVDPAEAKESERAAQRADREKPTFGEAADLYIRERIEPKSRNEKHIYQWRQTLGDQYCKALRSLRVDKVQTDDVVAVLMREDSKRVGGDQVRGKLWTLKNETASRLRGRIEQVLDYATWKKWRTGDNPARWAGCLEYELPELGDIKPRRQPAMPYKDVPSFVSALRGRNTVSARALEFAILTAARSGEVRGATWEEIDLDHSVWTIPDARMKAGNEHRVPLSGRAIEILKEMAPDEALRHGWIFPGTKPGAPISVMVFNMLMRRMGVTGATTHGFRSSFRDWAGDEGGFDRELAEFALAHVVGNKVERAYRRDTAFMRRAAMMEAWAGYCAGVRPADNVVALRA